MPLEFNEKGYLSKGIHPLSGEGFIETFCNSDYRKQYTKTISDIFDFARDRGAPLILFGGSFISNKKEPEDIDCIIVFTNDSDIPRKTEEIIISGVKLDVLFGSLESSDVVDTYLSFFKFNI